MSICEGCKKAADDQKWVKGASDRGVAITLQALHEHPKDCGCPCNHRDVGTVEFERPK